MSNQRKQKLSLRVCRKKIEGHKEWILQCGRFKKDGSTTYSDWSIENGQLPKALFFHITGPIFGKIKKLEKGRRNYDGMKSLIRAALAEAAIDCGCESEKKRYWGLRFLLDGNPLLDVAIFNFQTHRDASIRKLADQLRENKPRFVSMEKQSRALFRFAAVVLKSGIFRLVPGAPLPEEKRKWKG